MDNKYLLVLITILLSVSLASGAEDVLLGSDVKDISLCDCSSVNNTLIIKNTGDGVTLYTLSAEGAGARFSSLNKPLSFKLSPGKKLKVINSITSICGIQGEYDLNIRIRSNKTDKVLDQRLDVKRCSNIDVRLKEYEKTVNPCDQLYYEINITNIGTFLEEYSFDIEPLYQHQFSANNIQLKPDNRAILYLKLKPCIEYGTKELKLVTKAKNSRLTAKTPLKLNIVEPYLLESEDKSFCETDEAFLPIKIKNIAAEDKEFSLELETVDFAALNESEFKVSPGKTYTASLAIDPSIKAIGQYNLTLVVKENNAVSVKHIPFSIKQCSSANLKIADVKDEEIACGAAEYKVIVKNSGNLTENITLKLEAPKYVSLSNSSLALAPGEESSILLQVKDTGSSDEGYVTIKAELESGFSEQQSFMLSTREKSDCYSAGLSIKDFRWNEQGLLKIKNNGLKPAVYKLSVDSDKLTISPSEVNLQRGESATVNIVPDKSDRTSKDTFTIKAEANGVSYDTTVTVGESAIVKKAKRAAVWSFSIFKRYILYLVAGFIIFIILLFILLKLLSMENVTLPKVAITLLLLIIASAVYYYWKLVKPYFWAYINYFIAGIVLLIILITALIIASHRKEKPEEEKKEEEDKEDKKKEEKLIREIKAKEKEISKKETAKAIKKKYEEEQMLKEEEDSDELELPSEFKMPSRLNTIIAAIVLFVIVAFFTFDYIKPYLLLYWKFIALGIFILLLIISVLNLLSDKSSRLNKYLLSILVIVAVISFVYVKYPAAGLMITEALTHLKLNLGYIPNWLSLYLNYIILGIVILIIVILFLRLSNDDEIKKRIVSANSKKAEKKSDKEPIKKNNKKAAKKKGKR